MPNARRLPVRSALLACLVTLAVSLAASAAAEANFNKCSLAGIDGGTQLGPTSVSITSRVQATIKFQCTGINPPPRLNSYGPGVGVPVAIGGATFDGGLWKFTLDHAGGQAASGQLLFLEESVAGAQQVLDISVAANPFPDPRQTSVCDVLASDGGVPAQLEAREPGGTSFAPVPETVLCAFVTLRNSSTLAPSLDVSGPVAGYINVETPQYLGPWPYPEGTTFRISGGIPGFTPISGAGGFKNPRLRIEGERFVVEGEAVTRKVFDASLGEGGCAEARTSTVLGGVVLGPRFGRDFLGTIVSNNGYTYDAPRITSGGLLEYSVAGCGDGNPATLEGFYDAQFGKAFLDSGGVTQAVLAASDDAAVQALFNVTNNGVASGATFTKAAGQEGQIVVLMNYRTSFSEHTIGVRANKKATAFARKCTKAKGSKLRTRTQTIKVKKKRVKATFLTCTPRKGKSSKLKVG